MELEKKIRSKTAILIVLAFGLYIGFNYWNNIMGIFLKVYNLIFPFILGGCIAFILNIPAGFISKKLLGCSDKGIGRIIKKHSTGISIVISFFAIVGIFVLISSIIVPNIIETVAILPKTFDNSTKAFQKWMDSNTKLSSSIVNLVNNMGIDWNNIFNKAKSIIFNGIGSMVLSTLQAATSLASATVEFILGVIFAIYILAQKKRIGIQFKKLLYAFMKKEKADSILDILKLTNITFSNFITGQCIVAAILGMMFFVVMMLLSMPYALMISVLIGFLSIIPVLGSAIGCALSVVLIVMVNPIKAGVFLLVFLLIKQIEDNLIYPKVVGESVGLPSIWVLVAITLGGKIFGVAGMIIFIPLFSVAYVLLRKEVYIKLKQKGLKIE